MTHSDSDIHEAVLLAGKRSGWTDRQAVLDLAAHIMADGGDHHAAESAVRRWAAKAGDGV